ncbi:serine/threonine-protein kinase [Streptomyces roseus]|uniref:non-specific serine/threonine protein kinase n=1 Tax=Streptomyces roseus TaxID=66430 RepID=A0A0J6XIL5_9ACTN|nr:serine/threonine-protein kinase [Streptomyces roseus]KMO94062.1 serine/threonine protein phosphatase [Streptomyces roseus]
MTAGEANGGELVGRVLGGRYRVTAMIGRGGMGVVARAVDELLGREVAVKVMRAYTDASAPELADLRARMRREAQAAARIRHAGVVTVHDVTEEEGLPVIVMELVDGPSLDEVLERRGPLEPHEAAAIGAKLMDALDAAHRAGVLHRDVKPANVLLEPDGRVVLTDFGIAAVQDAADEDMAKLTRSGSIVGSLDYLPPERAQGREPGPASDIWSLGMTLYAAVEGVYPFRRTSAWSTLSAIVTEPLPEPRRAGALTPVLRALMAKEPQSRPSAGRAREMLRAVAEGRDPHAAGPAAFPPAAAPRPGTAPSLVPPPAAAPMAGPPPGAVPHGAPTPPPGYGPAPVPYPRQSPQPPYPGQAMAAPRHTMPAPGPSGPIPYTGAGTGAPTGPHAPTPARATRGRIVTGAAVAVVLAGGGITYAAVGGHGGGGAQAHAAPPETTRSPSTAHSSRSPKPSKDSGKPGKSPTPAPSGKSAGASPKPSSSAHSEPTPVSTACTGWGHQDRSPGTYGFMSGTYHITTGPYQECPAVAVAKSGTKLTYQCYVVNAHGNKWTYVHAADTNASGWMSDDNLTRQKGPSNRC